MDRDRLIKDGTRFFGFDDDENPRSSISQCAANHIFPVGIIRDRSPESMQASVGTHFMAFIPAYILPTVCGKKFSRRTSKLSASSMNKERPSLFRSNVKLAPGKNFSGNKIYS